jgi:hypothetical protein
LKFRKNHRKAKKKKQSSNDSLGEIARIKLQWRIHSRERRGMAPAKIQRKKNYDTLRNGAKIQKFKKLYPIQN